MELLTAPPTPLLSGEDTQIKRAEIKAYFQNSWARYESLFSLISNDDAYFKKAEPLRHPLIFYFGHTATFFINKLKLGKYIDERINDHFESMFAIGVDEMSWDDLNDAHYDWPQVDEVRAYRNAVRALIESLIDTMPLELPIGQSSLAWAILMGIEHERIHLETSSVIIRQLPLEDLTPSMQWPECRDYGEAPDNPLIQVKGGDISLGKVDEDLTYGWDNEYGRSRHHISDFRASEKLVSNGEFMAFVKAGGYKEPKWWSDEGNAWREYTNANMPRFWRHIDGRWYQRNLCSEIPLPLNWPVEVNQLEAKAFCNWKAATTERSIRLPTEAEWY